MALVLRRKTQYFTGVLKAFTCSNFFSQAYGRPHAWLSSIDYLWDDLIGSPSATDYPRAPTSLRQTGYGPFRPHRLFGPMLLAIGL